MLEQIRDIFQPIRKTDPRFGDLRYQRAARFWEGRSPFRPLGHEVEVLISGASTGPTEPQRAFYGEVEARYPSLWPRLQESLVSEAQRVSAPTSDFKLVAVDIPEVPSEHASWELSYESAGRSWHFTLSLIGWEPKGVVADCL
jgi:hypothetical protein